MPYNPIIAPTDLTTHIYPEILYEIARTDAGTANESSQLLMCIQTAIDETRIYLTRYDIVAIFGDQVSNVSNTFTPDSLLLDIVKVIAIWKLITSANTNMLYETWRDRYKTTIDTLKRIQKGEADPPWPFATQAESSAPSYAASIIAQPLRNVSGIPDNQA